RIGREVSPPTTPIVFIAVLVSPPKPPVSLLRKPPPDLLASLMLPLRPPNALSASDVSAPTTISRSATVTAMTHHRLSSEFDTPSFWTHNVLSGLRERDKGRGSSTPAPLRSFLCLLL